MFGRRRQKPGNGNENLFVARRREASVEAVAEPILQAFGVDLKDWHGDESEKTIDATLGKVFPHFSNVAQNTLPEITSPPQTLGEVSFCLQKTGKLQSEVSGAHLRNSPHRHPFHESLQIIELRRFAKFAPLPFRLASHA